MQRIALLGLGIMGSGMAANWLKAGFDLTVYNRTRSKAEPFAALGAHVVDTPREAARHADVIVAMVTDDKASQAVWLGGEGVGAGALDTAKPGALVIECSTISPDWVRELARQVELRGFDFLESPVTGSKAAAADGQLVLFVGGSAKLLDQARPVLAAISRQINHMGDIGMGATWKLINNMQIAVHLAVAAEALALGEKAGLNRDQIATLITEGAGSSPIVKAKLPRMTEQRFADPDFTVDNILKDARYALALAEKLGFSLPDVQAAAALYQRASEHGLGNQDFSAVLQAVEQ